jgi:site-specific recombinase XerD
VVATVPFPKVPRPLPEILTGSEVERVLSCITSIKYRTVAAVSYGAGLRLDEALRLRPGDIDATRGVILVREGKGRKARQIMLGQRLLSMLREYWRVTRPQGEWLFTAEKDPARRASPRSVREALHKATRAARIRKRVTPHTLRHSFATHLLELGNELEAIQLLLGHSSMRTTLHYTRIRAEFLRRMKSPLDVVGTSEGELLG